jgi:hypothetical protein
MEKTQKFITDSDNMGFSVAIDENFSQSAFFCPICDFIMNNLEDPEFYQEFGCCSECGMKFAQPRRFDWKKGWRPSKIEVDSQKMAIENQPLNLFLVDGHN